MSVKLDKRAWEKLKKKLKKSAKAHVKVGVLSSKGGNAQHSDGISVLELAAIHEFGSPAAGIPQRSFIRDTFKNNTRQTQALLTKLAKAILDDRMTHRKALDTLGIWGSAQVKNFVMSGNHIEPPLKPATAAAKNSTRPLIDTGRLINSVNHEVVD